MELKALLNLQFSGDRKGLAESNSFRGFLRSKRAFAFSADAVLAVILVASAIALTQASFFEHRSFSLNQLKQQADDVFSVLQDTGFLFQETDRNDLQSAAYSFYLKAKPLLPQGSKLSLRLVQYDLDKEACRNFKDFENCFSFSGSAYYSDLHDSNEIAFGKRLIVKKQSPGDCNVVAELSPKNSLGFPSGKAFFSPEIAFFQSAGGDLNIDVQGFYEGGYLSPGNTVECDKNVRVDLNAYIDTTGRPPVNIIFGADKSSSTGECAIAKGNVFDSSSGTLPSSFQKIREFSISDNNSFDVLLEWQQSCSSDCPQFYIVAPNGTTKYGFGFPSVTDINVSSCNPGDVLNSKAYYLNKSTFAYLALNSNVANPKAGTWQVWAQKPGTAFAYNLTVKKIRNDYFSSSTLLITPWNNPISKIELAQVFVARVNENALWDDLADEYAFAEIGKDKKGSGDNSSIQPASGLRPVGDQAFKSQLKNLASISTDFSAFGFALDGRGMINEFLAREPSIQIRAVILFGDGDSNGTPGILTAANSAKDKNIFVFSVGFGRDYNFTDLKLVSQITKGEFYNAQDENALDSIFELIAQKIFALSAMQEGVGVSDLNLTIPIIPGSIVSNPSSSFQGTFELSSEFLKFFVHDVNVLSPWNGSYDLIFPCTASCANELKYLPEFGTQYQYVDDDGNFFSNDFDLNRYIDVNLFYRDLVVSFENAELVDINHVSVVAKISNIGDLNTLNYPNSFIDLNFYANSSYYSTKKFNPLCSIKSQGCVSWFDINSEEFFTEGEFLAKIDENAVRDCPNGNSAKIYCRSQLLTQFYILEFGVWQ